MAGSGQSMLRSGPSYGALGRSGPVRLSVVVVAIGLAIIAGSYGTTLTQMAELWLSRSTYHHAVLVLPIAIWLAHDSRERLVGAGARPFGPGVLLVLAAGTAWWIGELTLTAELSHWAVVALVHALVLAACGPRTYGRLIFPLTYLWLLVPSGTALLPHLQTVTTEIAAALLDLAGVAVHADRHALETPGGVYDVTPGCAGLNFLYAMLTVAPLYAYVTYRSAARRFAAVVLAIVVAIGANGLRVALIVWLAETVGARGNLAEDHLLFGWGFFALVMIVLALIGARFAESRQTSRYDRLFFSSPGERYDPRLLSAPTVALLIFAAIVVFPAQRVVVTAQSQPTPAPLLPASVDGWQRLTLAGAPSDREGVTRTVASYVSGPQRLTVRLDHIAAERHGLELAALAPTPPDAITIDAVGGEILTPGMAGALAAAKVRARPGRHDALRLTVEPTLAASPEKTAEFADALARALGLSAQ